MQKLPIRHEAQYGEYRGVFFLSELRSDDCSLASRSAIIYFYTSQPAAG